MIEWTRMRLSQWGKWCRGRAVSGYPSASAFFYANSGERSAAGTEAPDDIAEVDAAVAKISAPLRQVLILFYCTTGPVWWKAQKVFTSRRTLMRRVRLAEERVNFHLGIAGAPKS